MRLLIIACAILALAAPPAPAADCATTAEADALKIAAMRQQLIAAALFCGEADAYHRFASGFRTDLQSSDAALKVFFARHGLADGGEAFKARAAKLSDQERTRDGVSFCASTRALLTAATAWHGSLAGFVNMRARATDTAGLCKAFPVMVAKPRPVPPPVRLAVVTPPPTARPASAAILVQPPLPKPEPLRARAIVPSVTQITLTLPRLPEEPSRIARTATPYDRDAEERSWRAWDIAHRSDWRAENVPQPPYWYPQPQGWYPGWYPPPPYYRRW